MAPQAAATEFRDALDALAIAQHRVAQLFHVSQRSVRRWRDGDRRIPVGVDVVIRLLAAGTVTVDQVEAASTLTRVNGSAKPGPPALSLVEPAPAPTEAADLGPTTAGFHFCSAPAVGGPYCEAHRRQAYRDPAAMAPTHGQTTLRRIAWGSYARDAHSVRPRQQANV
jgi:hypothetical protein